MNYFHFSFIFLLFFLAVAGEFDIPSGSSRRLLSRKRVHSSSVDEKKSSPPKYARSGLPADTLPAYIRPSSSPNSKRKIRSNKASPPRPKISKKTDQHKDKRVNNKKKKPRDKHGNGTQKNSVDSSKSRGLVAINDADLSRCRALLHIDPPVSREENKKGSSNQLKKKSSEENRSSKEKKPPVEQPKKNDKSKEKPSVSIDNGKKSTSKASVVDETPTATLTPVKSKREKPPPIIEDVFESLDHVDLSPRNDSVVNRAFHFVKNMFQLSDDILDMEAVIEQRPIDSNTDQHEHQSRKLLSIEHCDDEDEGEKSEFQSFVSTFSKRRLLSVKSSKQSTSQKEKKPVAEKVKPKVGWAYRYRISRYLEAQKMQQTGKKGKSQSTSKSKSKQKKSVDSNSQRKVSKRQLLQHQHAERSTSKDDLLDSVTITEQFRPKQSRHQFTDPTVIVKSYDSALYQPPIDSQIHHRLSRCLQMLRENNRDKQECFILDEQKRLEKNSKLDGPRQRQLSRKSSAQSSQRIVDDRNKFRHKSLGRKDLDRISKKEENDLDSKLSSIIADERRVGWNYRYRIRRKSKHFQRQEAEQDDPLNSKESSSLLTDWFSTIERNFCLMPLPLKISFCDQFQSSSDNAQTRSNKKLRTKKEHRAKQFIRARPTKLGADDKVTERRVDEQMRVLYATPSLPPVEKPPASPKEKKITIEKPTKTPALPRLRTISEVIREEAASLFIQQRKPVRTLEDFYEESKESIHERAKYRSKSTTSKRHSPSSLVNTSDRTIDEEAEIISNDHLSIERVHDQYFDLDNNKTST